MERRSLLGGNMKPGTAHDEQQKKWSHGRQSDLRSIAWKLVKNKRGKDSRPNVT